MQIRLSDHFSFGRLLRFTLPSIAMMILTSLYSVADGLFVSNMIGDIGLSAVNIMFPVAMLISAVGFMLGTGGSAVVARTLVPTWRTAFSRCSSLPSSFSAAF